MDFAPVHKQNEGRDAADAVTGRDRLLFLGVELEESVIRFQLGRGAFVGWCHGTAWSAPWSPEINEHRNVIAREVALKAFATGGNRLSGEQLLVTAPAFGLPCGPIRWNSVDRAAMRTDDVTR
jgi:hypothetical protein